MPEREKERIVRKIFEALDRHDVDDYLDYFADNVVYVDADGNSVGKEGVQKEIVGLLESFPDLRVRIDHMVSRFDTVWVEWTAKGTHRRDLPGMPVTNKTFETQAVWICVIKSGKVKIWKVYYNPNRLIHELSE